MGKELYIISSITAHKRNHNNPNVGVPLGVELRRVVEAKADAEGVCIGRLIRFIVADYFGMALKGGASTVAEESSEFPVSGAGIAGAAETASSDVGLDEAFARSIEKKEARRHA